MTCEPKLCEAVSAPKNWNPETGVGGSGEVDTREGSLDNFIAAFNRFEVEQNLFNRCRDRDGFPWWDVVRYNVQMALCAPKGLISNRTVRGNGIFSRAKSFARQCHRLLRESIRIACLRRNSIDRIYVFSRKSEYLLEELGACDERCLVVGEVGGFYGPHATVTKQSFDFFTRIAKPFIRVPEDVANEAFHIDGELRSKFGGSADIAGIIGSKYAQDAASRVAWSFVLFRQEAVTYVGLIGDDTLKGLVFLANARNIATREFQHAYMGRAHVNYSYPDLHGSVATLPREVMVHRDTGDIVYPVTRVRPQRSKMVQGSRMEVERDIDVLVGGTPTWPAEVVEIVGSLVDKGLSVAVKLHPSQTEADSGLRERFSKEQVRIYAGGNDFCALAQRSRIYVPGNPTSTTVFEAVENGALLVVVDYNGVKFTGMIDDIVSGRVNAYEDLFGAITAQLNSVGNESGDRCKMDKGSV